MEHTKYLITVQAWVYVSDAREAENIAVRVAAHAEEANEDPAAPPSYIQTCIAQKAPFAALIHVPFWTGESVDEDIEAAERHEAGRRESHD
jgi:hypothetical protein